MMLGLLLAVVFTIGWIPVFVYRTEVLADALPAYHGDGAAVVVGVAGAADNALHAGGVTLSFVDAIPAWSAAIGLAVYGACVPAGSRVADASRKYPGGRVQPRMAGRQPSLSGGRTSRPKTSMNSAWLRPTLWRWISSKPMSR